MKSKRKVTPARTSSTFRSATVFLFVLGVAQGSRQVFKIHWNASNPIFRIDNTDNVFDVNRGNEPWEHDQVHILCPHYGVVAPPHRGWWPGGSGGGEDLFWRFAIYNVSKEEYESCRLLDDVISMDKKTRKPIAMCDQPEEPKFFTITFRSFTPIPGALEFVPGKDYYFVSMVQGLPRPGGPPLLSLAFHEREYLCRVQNMKAIFKVAGHRAVEKNDVKQKNVAKKYYLLENQWKDHDDLLHFNSLEKRDNGDRIDPHVIAANSVNNKPEAPQNAMEAPLRSCAGAKDDLRPVELLLILSRLVLIQLILNGLAPS